MDFCILPRAGRKGRASGKALDGCRCRMMLLDGAGLMDCDYADIIMLSMALLFVKC